jgi:hypothetical protein
MAKAGVLSGNWLLVAEQEFLEVPISIFGVPLGLIRV